MLLLVKLKVKTEIFYAVVVGNIFNHFAEYFEVLRVTTCFNPLADFVAEYSSKILVAGVGKE